MKLTTINRMVAIGTYFAVAQFPCYSQTTVGNATLTPVTPHMTEQFGVTSPFSTHQRNGNQTGIGSSYLSTESVTSESRARTVGRLRGDAAPEVTEPRLNLPTGLSMPSVSPSLQNPDLMSINGRSNMTPVFELNQQSIPNFSFKNSQNPALQMNRLGGSSYSILKPSNRGNQL